MADAKQRQVSSGGSFRVKAKKRGKAKKNFGPKENRPKAYRGQGRKP